MQILPWPSYSPDMSLTEHVSDLVGWCLAHDPRPLASKDELWLRIRAIWNSLPEADIQNLFDSMTRHIAALIAARVATPNTDFGLFFALKISSFICTNISSLSIKFHLILMIPLWCCILYKQQSMLHCNMENDNIDSIFNNREDTVSFHETEPL